LNGWVKIKGAADYIGLSARSVRTLLKKGLRFSKLDTGTVLISIRNIDEYLTRFEVEIDESRQVATAIESEVDRIIREIETGK
jgi:hypothetical protein